MQIGILDVGRSKKSFKNTVIKHKYFVKLKQENFNSLPG